MAHKIGLKRFGIVEYAQINIVNKMNIWYIDVNVYVKKIDCIEQQIGEVYNNKGGYYGTKNCVGGICFSGHNPVVC